MTEHKTPLFSSYFEMGEKKAVIKPGQKMSSDY